MNVFLIFSSSTAAKEMLDSKAASERTVEGALPVLAKNCLILSGVT